MVAMRHFRLIMTRLVAGLLVATLSSPTLAQPARPEAETVARSLQSRYDGVRDFSADFTHTYRGGVLRTHVTERGTMAVKRPGMMRWRYTSPEEKTFVSDGVKMYAYIPGDRQVIVSTLPPAEEAPTPALFLAGQGNLSRDFDASWADDQRAGVYTLRLVPHRESTDYASLVVTLSPATLQIQEFSSVDRQGGRSTFSFSNLKENQGLPDKQFAFSMPQGVDILTDDQTSR